MNQKICPKCKTQTELDSKFCPNCGYSFESKNNNENNRKVIKEPNFDKNELLNELYLIIGKDDLNKDYINWISSYSLDETVGKNIKSKCITLIKEDSFFYQNILKYDSISFENYSYLMNRVAYTLIKDEKEFKKRSVYGYFGKEANQNTIIQTIVQNGTNYAEDALINEFVECAIVDNKRLSFLPKYMKDKFNRRFTRNEYINMANYVSKYEVDFGVSPKIVPVSNKLFSKNQKIKIHFYKSDNIHSIVFDKLQLILFSYSTQIHDALEKLNNSIGKNADGLIFKGRLKFTNLDQNPHGISIKNKLENNIYSLNLTADDVDDKISEEIENEIENKKNRLINNTYEIIGQEDIKQSFLDKINQYHLNREDAIKIKTDIIDKINSNSFHEADYDENLNKIIEKYKIKRKHELLTLKLDEIINSPLIIEEFKNNLILDKKGVVQEEIIKDINNNQVNSEEDIKIRIRELIFYYERKDVENELNNLDDFVIDLLLDKFSINSILPLKSLKINKLIDNVGIPVLKVELSNYGVNKYKTSEKGHKIDEDGFKNINHEKDDNEKSGGNDDLFDDGEKNSEFKICPNCNTKIKSNLNFCTQCGTKL